jgi:hypothetical protein
MAKLYDLARMTTATTGTGTITLGAAVSGFLTFALAGVSDGDVVSYGIKDGANSECGTGTYTASGTTLSRTVTKSTNSNAAISLSGSAEVYVTARAEDILVPANNLSDVANVTSARSSLYAAPFDALAYNGMQVNGSMEVSQVNGTSLVSAAAGYIVDGFLVSGAGTMVLAAQQVADAPPGLTNSLRVTVTTAEASLGASDFAAITTLIEGYRTSRLSFGTANAQSVSIGFWTKIHRTGTYSGALRSAAGNRSYPFTFTQSVADTWQFNTVTIPGDTTGTWVGNTNTASLSVVFSLACGTTFAGTAGSWSAGNFLGATGTTNGVAATSDVFQLTGIIVLPGIELPSSARASLIMRSFDQEWLTCMRYYEKSCDYGTAPLGASNVSGSVWGVATSTTTIITSILFKVPKRAGPTLTPWSFNGSSGKWANISNADTAALTQPLTCGQMGMAGRFDTTGLTAGAAYWGNWLADARL